MLKITEGTITFTIEEEDFERAMGRPPRTQEDFNNFSELIGKCLKDTEHINWDIVYEHVKEGMKDFEPIDEVIIELKDGYTLRSSSETRTAGDYVRLVDKYGHEVLYWHYDEWRDEPILTMGAIVCAMAGIEVVAQSIKKGEEDDKHDRDI